MSAPDGFGSATNSEDSLIAAVARKSRKLVVVLETGGPNVMPWINQVPAVLEAWFAGVSGGSAIADILFGAVNPSGKLPLTFPVQITDIPTPLNIEQNPVFSERIEMGYWWYDTQGIAPLFEFGYGLSYTTFAYSDLKTGEDAQGNVTIVFNLTNTGKVAGAEVPQAYFRIAGEEPKRLVGWGKLMLNLGETDQVTFVIPPERHAVWQEGSSSHDGRWVDAAVTRVLVGSSSRILPLQAAM